MPPSKGLNGKRNENDFFPLAGLEGLGILSTLSNFESVAGNDSGAIHRGALKRIDDGDVVGSVSAPNPAPDEDIGGAGVIARKESPHFSSGSEAGGDGATVKVIAQTVVTDDGFSLHGAGDGVVAESIVELSASANARAWIVEDRDAKTIERIHPELLGVEVQVEVFRRDGV